MKSKITQSIWALLLLCLVSPSLYGQPFQRIYAYDPGTGLETGIYHDVVCLPYVASNNVNVVTIGESNIPIQDGVLGYKDQAGNTIRYFEYRSTLGHPVLGEAVDDLPSGPIVACFYDPVAQATDVVVTNAFGTPMAMTRVPDFEVKDVVCGQAPYSTGEGVWLTGRTPSNNQLAVCGFDGPGLLPVFFNSYFLVDPAWNFNGTIGFEIELDLPTNTLVVVGTATIAAFPARTTALFARFTPAGAFVGGTSFSDPALNDFYHGKALTQHPFNMGNYVIAFEYSNTGMPFDRPGLMEVNGAGFPLWLNVYFGAGFFGGNNYITNGVRSDGTELMVSGYFNSTAAGPTSGYALNTDAFGNPIIFSEYETTTPFYVPNGTGFWGMDWNVVNGHYYMDGYYNTVNMGGGWPVGPDPRGMWLVAAKPNGNSVCNTQDVATIFNPGPKVNPLNNFTTAMLFPVPPRLKRFFVDPRDVDQCFNPKRHPGTEIVAEAAAQVTVGYRELSREILITLSGELTGEGTARLYDLQGRTLAEIRLDSERHTIDASSFSNGVYLLRFEVPGIASGTQKVVVH